MQHREKCAAHGVWRVLREVEPELHMLVRPLVHHGVEGAGGRERLELVQRQVVGRHRAALGRAEEHRGVRTVSEQRVDDGVVHADLLLSRALRLVHRIQLRLGLLDWPHEAGGADLDAGRDRDLAWVGVRPTEVVHNVGREAGQQVAGGGADGDAAHLGELDLGVAAGVGDGGHEHAACPAQ
eukprot:scaffold100402_cov87-Phaeocystis_antarctica.AAC.2